MCAWWTRLMVAIDHFFHDILFMIDGQDILHESHKKYHIKPCDKKLHNLKEMLASTLSNGSVWSEINISMIHQLRKWK